MVIKWIALCVGAYLLGSINFARVISRVFRHEDITQKGSGNPGASNMLRTYGIKIFILTFLLDAIKGLVSALIGFYMFGGNLYNGLACIGLYTGGLCAVVGHIFPIFTRFKGGKGMATSIGAFAVSNLPLLLLFAFIGFLVFLKCRHMSVFTLIIIIFTGISDLVIKSIWYCPNNLVMIGLVLLMIALCVWAHRTNLVRLAQGTESKIGNKK